MNGRIKEINRPQWAMEELSKTFEFILKQFDEHEQENIRDILANYTIGYMGCSYKLTCK